MVLSSIVGSKTFLGTATTAVAGGTFAISENVVITCLTVFLGVIGWLIKVTFDSFRNQINKQNEKLDAVIKHQHTIQGGLTYQNERVELWHTDRTEVFKRLNRVETICDLAVNKKETDG